MSLSNTDGGIRIDPRPSARLQIDDQALMEPEAVMHLPGTQMIL